MLEGLDDIALSLEKSEQISSYEDKINKTKRKLTTLWYNTFYTYSYTMSITKQQGNNNATIANC